MAYEQLTYEFLMNRMLSRVTEDYPNLDTREGSVIFNAIASCAMECSLLYLEGSNILKESFVGTASRYYILLACQQMGIPIAQFEASSGVFQGEFDVEIELGSRWNLDMFNYEVIEYIGYDSSSGRYKYRMLCETVGTSANNQTGALTPITYVPSGLTVAEITACLVEGEDEKSDDEIRDTYFNYLNSTFSDGNVAQYHKWCDEYAGIGHYKVIPLWDGANTVKVSILNASNHSASAEFIAEVQDYFDPNINGMGDGVAPIGAFVTVDTATEVPINLSANVTMKNGYTDTTPIDEALNEYFSSIAYVKSQVAYMNVGSIILNVEGVESINNLTLNSGTADINLDTYEIPRLGTTNWTVV